MKQWFQNLTQREQIYLLAAAAAIILYLLLVAVWQPLSNSRDEMALRNVAVAEQLVRVQAMAGELQEIDAGRSSTRRVNMNQLINSSTNSFGIRPTRIQPNSRGETQIRFENVAFTDLMRWLHQVEAMDGILLREVAINQGDGGGMVKATIRLGQSA